MVEQTPEQIVRGIIAKHYPDYKDTYNGRRVAIGLEVFAAAEARGMEKAARIVEGMGTSFDSTAGERFAKAIRAALNGGQHE